jgi:DNA polymerase III subunit gamma/tau
MSHQVISRKWRPDLFEGVIGQTHITRTLSNAIHQGRLGHAYIFSGPRGTGKTTTARILAKSVNCLHPIDSNPCNQCISCVEITEGRSLDVQEIDGGSNRGIEDIRSLREAVKYAPTRGKFKVYIIDEFHQITVQAFNALLKTLEEPPPHVLFIFATTELNKVPATILSRCQRFEFRRIPLNEVYQHLRNICDSEGIDISQEALMLLARKGEGSMRDSQSFLEQVISYSDGKIDYELVADILGMINEASYFTVFDAILEKNLSQIVQTLDEIMSYGYDLTEFALGFTQFLRDLYLVKRTEDQTILETSDTSREQYRIAAEKADLRKLVQMMAMLTRELPLLAKTTNPRLIFESLLIRFIQLEDLVDLDQLIQKTQIAAPTAKVQAPAAAPAPRPKTVATERPQSRPPSETASEPASAYRPMSSFKAAVAKKDENLQSVSGNAPENVSKKQTDLAKLWDSVAASVAKNSPRLSGALPGFQINVSGRKIEIMVKSSLHATLLRDYESRFLSEFKKQGFEDIQIEIIKNQNGSVDGKRDTKPLDGSVQRVIQLFDAKIINN